MKIGNYSIPDKRIPALLDDLKTMYNKFEQRDIDPVTLAPMLGHKGSKSGGFLQKIADMRAYNLIEGRGKVRVTETGRRSLYQNSTQKKRMKVS